MLLPYCVLYLLCHGVEYLSIDVWSHGRGIVNPWNMIETHALKAIAH
jgi:hypothetical protein